MGDQIHSFNCKSIISITSACECTCAATIKVQYRDGYGWYHQEDWPRLVGHELVWTRVKIYERKESADA